MWAGVGFGGSCFPKDLKALQAITKAQKLPTQLIDAVISTNERQKEFLFEKIVSYFQNKAEGGLEGKTIGILGLSFKPDTDDIREAPALVLIEKLLKAKASLRLFDPVAMPNCKKVVPQSSAVTYCDEAIDVASDADALVLVTEWKEFRLLDFETIVQKMKGKAFFDGRNQYEKEEMAKQGFDYISIGRAPAFAILEQEFPWVQNEADRVSIDA